MAKIKFALRRNLIYPMQYILWSFSRNILSMVTKYIFGFGDSLFHNPIMYLGELLGGGIFYLYQKKYTTKKEEEKVKYFMSVQLITNNETDDDYFIPLYNNKKILLLMFMSSFFDGFQFLLYNSVLPKFKGMSVSLNTRLNGISILIASLFYVYILRLPIFKHQKFSLLIIGICLIVIIIFEFIFHNINELKSYDKINIAFVLSIFVKIFDSFNDIIEKYLFEFDYMNPFIVLMYEGLFGFVFSFLYFIYPEYMKDVIKVYEAEKESPGRLALFIFLLFLYIIFSAGKNVFRVVTNKIYSPMTKSLMDYILTPVYLFIYCFNDNDFRTNGELNIPYFLINLILSFIISFFGCVFNEFIILLFCGLHIDTHNQISERASSSLETEMIKLDDEVVE